jgi:uncharacterized protein (DUF433 family)
MAIPADLAAQPPPMEMDEDGVVRVGGTRVRLDTIITAYNNGCGAEGILLKYPSLTLTDIYAVITYYLWNRPEVELYLARRQKEIEEAHREIEERFPSQGVRERLLARRSTPTPT